MVQQEIHIRTLESGERVLIFHSPHEFVPEAAKVSLMVGNTIFMRADYVSEKIQDAFLRALTKMAEERW